MSLKYIILVFETIWNCREKKETMSLKHALLWYLKRFGTAEKFLKTMSLNNVFIVIAILG